MAHHKHISCETLEICDSEGNKRIQMFVTDDSLPVVQLIDNKGRVRIDLQIDSEGIAGMSFSTENNFIALSIGQGKDATGINCWSPNGNNYFSFNALNDGIQEKRIEP